MKNKFKFSNSSIYFKMFLALTLVITIITSSLPIVYSATNTVNALRNPDFESGSDSWTKSSGNITVQEGEGKTPADSTTPSAALKLTDKDNDNAVYQTVTNSDGSDFVQGSTFNWEFNFKSTTTDDIVALVLGTSVPSGDPDQFRKMIDWISGINKVAKKIPADGQYQVIVYSKPFENGGAFDNGKFGNLRADFSLTPTMYCTEKWTVVLARTNTENWKNISNPATTPFTLVKNSPSITYSLLSYNGEILVDDVSFLIEKKGEVATTYNNLQNGSFEDPTIESLKSNTFYAQPDHSKVPHWNTTAFGKKIELFNTVGNGTNGHFLSNKNIQVVDGKQAAELNADEASSLYQYINTEAGSKYKWQLSHRGRAGSDIMALVIGPKQFDKNGNVVDPAKTSKAGSDQFMAMIEWVKDNRQYYPKIADQIEEFEKEKGKTDNYKCTPIKMTVYSRPFAENGGFVGGTSTNFSSSESTVFTEKWDISLICTGYQEWGTYGENDSDDYSEYNVPDGQKESIFAFTAYHGTYSGSSTSSTYGNLLDGIKFDLYYPASSVSFTGGDAVLNYVYKDELLTAKLKSGEPAQSIMVDENSTFTLDVTPKFSTTIENGEEVPRKDAQGNKIQNTFLGAYITIGGQRKYYPATAINSTDNAVYFSETTETVNGEKMTVYHYGQSNVSGRVVVELVYSEVYTMIYNSKGGAPYSVRYSEDACKPDTSHMDWSGSNANIARFYEKATCTYTSTACDWWEYNPNVVFKGWELVGGTIYKLPETDTGEKTLVSEDEKVLFRGNATVNYTKPELTKEETDGLDATKVESLFLERAREVDFIINDGIYEGRVNAYAGGVLVANWEYKTSVIAQTEQLDGSFKRNREITNGKVGGQVKLADHTTEVTDITNVDKYPENDGTLYPTTTNDDGKTVGKPIDYTDEFTFASAFNNIVKASQQTNTGYKFLGWYDENGNKLSATSDHSFTIVPYFSTDDKSKTYQTPGVVYARFGFEYKVKFHINDSNTVSTVVNPDDDLYRVYYPKGVDISQAQSFNLNYEILHLDSNNKIQHFYDIPTPKSNYGKIFKGWYRDPSNDTDTNPIKWNYDPYETDIDIYAHWIDVGTVQQDPKDEKIIDQNNRPFVNENTGSNKNLWGFDLAGVQIRYEEKDKNYPDGIGNGEGQTPHFTTDGLRFVTYLKEDILSKASTLFMTEYTGFTTKEPLRYGYVVAKESTAKKYLTNGESLEYKDSNVNGVDTSSTYSFVTNADCTSSVGGYKDTSILDHENFDNYRIYSLIIAYDTKGMSDAEIASAKSQNVVARPYLRYQDANGLYRTYYQDYTGNANKYGGCSTNYTDTKNYLKDNGFFPEPTTAPAN